LFVLVLCTELSILTSCQCCSGTGEAQQLHASFSLSPETVLEMVYCPAGSYIMGSPIAEFERNNDEIQHNVTLSKPFFIGKFEVTQKQYETLMGSNPSCFKDENRPVERVTWHDAVAFCEKLNEITRNARPKGYVFTLPTEAQWEYACRAGTTTAWNSGKDIMHPERHDAELDEVAWNYYNSDKQSQPVGGKLPNKWGIYDMHGNVWEWCLDWMEPYHGDAVDPLPQYTPDKLERVGRGGSWYYGSDRSRAGYRDSLCPSDKDCDVGFRVALTPVMEMDMLQMPK
ncbi:MAG: formylglycine-generating enzyme family protein, partial [Lentisphaeria bacterium]|nr:formylglycine-generating enzyme family protein [Lentisphaeria bacterium]